MNITTPRSCDNTARCSLCFCQISTCLRPDGTGVLIGGHTESVQAEAKEDVHARIPEHKFWPQSVQQGPKGHPDADMVSVGSSFLLTFIPGQLLSMVFSARSISSDTSAVQSLVEVSSGRPCLDGYKSEQIRTSR
jgi:hypothetical protein